MNYQCPSPLLRWWLILKPGNAISCFNLRCQDLHRGGITQKRLAVFCNSQRKVTEQHLPIHYGTQCSMLVTHSFPGTKHKKYAIWEQIMLWAFNTEDYVYMTIKTLSWHYKVYIFWKVSHDFQLNNSAIVKSKASFSVTFDKHHLYHLLSCMIHLYITIIISSSLYNECKIAKITWIHSILC